MVNSIFSKKSGVKWQNFVTLMNSQKPHCSHKQKGQKDDSMIILMKIKINKNPKQKEISKIL